MYKTSPLPSVEMGNRKKFCIIKTVFGLPQLLLLFCTNKKTTLKN